MNKERNYRCRQLFVLFVGVLFLFSACAGDVPKSGVPEYQIGVWVLRFSNKVNNVTYGRINELIGVSSNLTLSVRGEGRDFDLKGIVATVTRGNKENYVVYGNNHETSYDLACETQQVMGVKVSVEMRERGVGMTEYSVYRYNGVITDDGQINLLPNIEDENGRVNDCFIMAVMRRK